MGIMNDVFMLISCPGHIMACREYKCQTLLMFKYTFNLVVWILKSARRVFIRGVWPCSIDFVKGFLRMLGWLQKALHGGFAGARKRHINTYLWESCTRRTSVFPR